MTVKCMTCRYVVTDGYSMYFVETEGCSSGFVKVEVNDLQRDLSYEYTILEDGVEQVEIAFLDLPLVLEGDGISDELVDQLLTYIEYILRYEDRVFVIGEECVEGEM